MTHRPADDALLVDLLEADRPARQMRTPSPALAPTPTARPVAARRPALRPWWFSETLYLKVQTVVALALGLVFSLGLWWVGARCTLVAAAAFGLPLGNIGVFAYVLPVMVTMVEVGLWPSRDYGLAPRIEWLVFLLLDALTTAVGVVREAPWLLPPTPTLAYAMAFALGLLIAILPERLIRSFIRRIYEELS